MKIVRYRGVPRACPPHAPVNRGDYGGVYPGHGSDDLIEVLIRILSVHLFQNLSVNLSRNLLENLSEIISGNISGNLSENLSGITLGYTPPHSEKIAQPFLHSHSIPSMALCIGQIVTEVFGLGINERFNLDTNQRTNKSIYHR